MNRKVVGGLVALVLVAVGVWFFAIREKPGTAKAVAPTTRAEKIDVWANAKPAPTDDSKVPAGLAPSWQQDVDPEGPLRLEGQVVDSTGQGVGDAELWLSSVAPRTAKSEGDGTFAFDKLVGREYTVVARAGKLVGSANYKVTEKGEPLIIRLVAGSKLAVAVTDDAEKPIADATIKVAESEVRAKTGADGVATLEPVAGGWVVVQATADGYAPANGFTQVAGNGASGSMKLTLRKGFAVSGRVTDESGKPVGKAQVTTAGVWDMPGGLDHTETDAKGQFTIKALPPGSHTLVATDQDHAPTRSAPITVSERAVSGIEIVMKEGGSITGSVVSSDGKGVAFATVRLAGDGQQIYTVPARQTTTDKSGAFTLTGVARTKLRLRAESDDAASAIVAIDLATEAVKKDVKLVLDVKGAIAGIVVDETGAPVPEVQVNAFPDILGGEAPEALAIAGMSSATTDGGGRFSIKGLPDGGYRLRASRFSGKGRYDWGQQGTKAKTGETNVKITLAAPGTIVGKIVIEGSSAPPKLATIQNGYKPSVRAAGDGTFKLSDVTPGKWDLHVRGPEFAEFAQRDVDVKSGKTTDVGTITVQRGRKVIGKVVDASGSPVAGAKVRNGDMIFSLQGAEDQMENIAEMYGSKSTVSDQDGKFVLVGIAKKETNIGADHMTKGRSNAIAIPAGTEDPPPITLTLRGFGVLVGKVTLQGKPLGGATVTDTPKGGGAQVQIAQSEADGSFTLTKASEGPHVVSAMQQDQKSMSFKSASTNVTVTAGKQTTVNIDIPVGAITLVIQIKPLPNNKVDAAQVFLFGGVVAMHNVKEMSDAFMSGAAKGMKFWFGEGKPFPEFEELVPGTYSACAIPVTGDLNNPTTQQRLQEHQNELEVICKTVKVTASPAKQTLVHELPAMKPLVDKP